MKAIDKLTQVENYCKCIDITERDELVEMVSDSKDLVMELYAALTRLTVCSKIITEKLKAPAFRHGDQSINIFSINKVLLKTFNV